MDARRDHRRRGFSLVELLVAIAIILVLMAMMGAAVSAARSGGARLKTDSSIAALDEILQRHFTGCESRRKGASGDRGVAIRRLVTADMPDSWAEVAHMKSQPQEFSTPRQRGYVAFYDAVKPSPDFGDAECLFMIVMQGGLADCLACTALDATVKGDKDGDGAMEFWDSWGEPIRFILWPGGFELPIGTKYFSTVAPFSGGAMMAGSPSSMRPLIFSGGPSKRSSTAMNDGSYLALGSGCGDPADPTIATLGGFSPASGDPKDYRDDNITNYHEGFQ